MKNSILLTNLGFFILAASFNSCKKEDVPTLYTLFIANITENSATSGGNISDDGGATITIRGVCWDTFPNPTTASDKSSDGSGTGTFTSNLNDLLPNRTYYVRAYATNNTGTAYANQLDFISPESSGFIHFNPLLNYGTVNDIEGNIYKTIQIGSQTWMAENLRTTEYNDGTGIPLVTNDSEWFRSTPCYCWYNNDVLTYKATYSALYNWYAVNTGKLCPTGWHIPNSAEWSTLMNHLGGQYEAGGKLKEAGLTHWESPNTNASNESGFTALPGGYRNPAGTFKDKGSKAYWWGADQSTIDYPGGRGTEYNTKMMNIIYLGASSGLSVRCVKN